MCPHVEDVIFPEVPATSRKASPISLASEAKPLKKKLTSDGVVLTG
jgi:hypothetical protein